jgi:hypothetical protein
MEEIPRPLPVNKVAQAPNHWVLFSCILKEWKGSHLTTVTKQSSKMQLTSIGSNMTEVETADARILFSYRTPVAAFIHGTGYVKTEKYWSSTTSRHINKWMGKDISDTCAKIPQADLDVLS